MKHCGRFRAQINRLRIREMSTQPWPARLGLLKRPITGPTNSMHRSAHLAAQRTLKVTQQRSGLEPREPITIAPDHCTAPWYRRGQRHGWEPLGPAMVMEVRGGLDAQGNVVAWDYHVWTPMHLSRPKRQRRESACG